MDVTSSQAGEQLQPSSCVVRDPSELLRLYREHDREQAAHSLVSSHISSRNADSRPEGGVIGKAVFLRRFRNDALVVGSPAHGKPPTARGIRKAIRCERPSNKTLGNLAFLLGNCEPFVRSMITATMADIVHFMYSVKFHRQVLRAFLEALRRRGFKHYVWVREFQENGSVHWHIFVCIEVTPTGQGAKLESVDVELSKELSRIFTGLYAKKSQCPLCKAGRYHECEASGVCPLGPAFRRMIEPHVNDKVGCVHAELMRAKDAAARYAAKEGSKRYQKRTQDARWRHGEGGAWCRASRGFTLPDYGDVMVSIDDVARCKFTLESGYEIDAPYRIQHGRGISFDEVKDDLQNGSEGES